MEEILINSSDRYLLTCLKITWVRYEETKNEQFMVMIQYMSDEYCYVTEGSYTCDKDRHKHRYTETLNADPNDMDIIDAMDMGE